MAHHLYGAVHEDWLDRCYDSGHEAIDQLLAECETVLDADAERAHPDRTGPDPDREDAERITALDALAAACIEAMLDDEMHAPRGIAPHSPLRDHPDFPLRLGQRVSAALHLYGALEPSRWGSVLLGLMARGLLMDGQAARALEVAALAVATGSAGGGTHTRLALGVMASALCAHDRPDLAAPLHLELWTCGHEIEAWKDPWEWEQAGPWTDGARFARNQDRGPQHRLWRRELQGTHADELGLHRLARMERFGLNRYHRLRWIRERFRSPWDLELDLLDLEDEAIQHEWEFL